MSRTRSFPEFLTRPNSIVYTPGLKTLYIVKGYSGISIVILFCRDPRETHDVLPLLGTHSTNIGHRGRFLSIVYTVSPLFVSGKGAGIPEDTIAMGRSTETSLHKHHMLAMANVLFIGYNHYEEKYGNNIPIPILLH